MNSQCRRTVGCASNATLTLLIWSALCADTRVLAQAPEEPGTDLSDNDDRGLGDPRSTITDPPAPRRAHRFTLLAGAGFSISPDARFASSFVPELGLYEHLSDWVSVGVRLRVGGGWSASDGARLQLALAAPSVRVHVRHNLGAWGAVEVGVHADGAVRLDWDEDRRFRADLLAFGLGIGVYATLELADAHGITLDATMMLWGLGGTDVSMDTSITLSYVARFD